MVEKQLLFISRQFAAGDKANLNIVRSSLYRLKLPDWSDFQHRDTIDNWDHLLAIRKKKSICHATGNSLQNREASATRTCPSDFNDVTQLVTNQRVGKVVKNGHHHSASFARAAGFAFTIQDFQKNALTLNVQVRRLRALKGDDSGFPR